VGRVSAKEGDNLEWSEGGMTTADLIKVGKKKEKWVILGEKAKMPNKR